MSDAATLSPAVPIIDIMRDTLRERCDNPQNDIISLLWQTEIDGNKTTIEDMGITVWSCSSSASIR
jgi:hypothetical protein